MELWFVFIVSCEVYYGLRCNLVNSELEILFWLFVFFRIFNSKDMNSIMIIWNIK